MQSTVTQTKKMPSDHSSGHDVMEWSTRISKNTQQTTGPRLWTGLGILLGGCPGNCLEEKSPELTCWRVDISKLKAGRGTRGKVQQIEGATCLFLNNILPKWKGQDSWCLLNCYNPLEHAIFHSGERKALGQDLQLELSVYQAGAGVRSSKKSSPEGIKSEIERWAKVVSNGHGKRPPRLHNKTPAWKWNPDLVLEEEL